MARDDFLIDEVEVSKVCNAHKSLGLKVGMRIMFIRNDFVNEISNCTIGIILNIEKDKASILFTVKQITL